MVDIDLAINSCFAIKRWPLPKQWMNIVHSSLEIGMCEFSLDLLDPFTREPTKTTYLQETTELCDELSLKIYSIYTGLQSYEKHLLFHPNLGMRIHTLEWLEKSIDIAATVDALAIGADFGVPDHSFFLDHENTNYFIEFLYDSAIYLNKVSYSAGLDAVIFNPPLVSKDYNKNIQIAQDLYQKVNNISSIPFKFSLNIQNYCISDIKASKSPKKEDYSWIKDLGTSLDVIRLQQTDGKDARFQLFSAEKNKLGAVNIDTLIRNIEDSGIKDCKFIIEVKPSYEINSEKVIEDLKSTVKYVKDRI